jgi:hypothetical protein
MTPVTRRSRSATSKAPWGAQRPERCQQRSKYVGRYSSHAVTRRTGVSGVSPSLLPVDHWRRWPVLLCEGESRVLPTHG